MKTNLIKRILFSLTLFFFSILSAFAQQEEQIYTVYFFGNLADVDNVNEFSLSLKKEFSNAITPFSLIINGDLVNEKIEKSNASQSLKKIYELADMMEQFPNGKMILLPGDRDWNNGGKGGEKSLRNLETNIQKYLKRKGYRQTKWTIKRGCPGPKVYDINEALTIVTLNSQWWNHSFDKPRPADGLCDAITPENLKEELEDVVEENQDKNILIVGHHPIHSLGHYGGYFSFGDQFKPFPIAGSFRTAFHTNIGGKRDISNEHLNEYVEGMNNLLFFHSNLIYASSHEKNQQVIRRGMNFLINSGAPAKADYVTRDEHTFLSKKAVGIMAIDYYNNGKVTTSFLELDNISFKEAEHQTLFYPVCGTGDTYRKEELINTSYLPCRPKMEVAQKMEGTYKGLKTLAAGEEYEVNGWKKFWYGKHYRTTWTTPIAVPYLDLDNTFGGLNIYKKGGGRQTTSLKFKSGNGTGYTFRSVNKDPSKALNYKLRPTFVARVFRDQTSTQHPYGAIAVAPLLDKIDILHANPVLYTLPNDSKLGPFQAKYGGLFGMLEENPGKPNNEGKLFGDADDIERSNKLFRDFYKHQKRRVNQSEFVRARLFDILVGDWSKHEDNWKWAAYDKPDGWRIYRPIPRDRDHVFSRQDGVIPWLADRRFALTNIENFDKDYKDILSLTWQARHMDRFLATEAEKTIFIQEAKFIQENISEQDIEEAIKKMPSEVYGKSGKEVADKLKNRLKNLQSAALEYYALLAKEVEVVGSIEEEFFEVNYLENTNVEVKVFDKKGTERGDVLLYQRAFLPSETKEIRLYGLGGEDVFDIRGNGESTIKIRLFGGPGDDILKDNAKNARSLLYDKGKDTQYELNGGGKIVNHWNKNIYEYDRTRYEYNRILPLIFIGYSRFSGFGVSLGAQTSVKKFGKDDYHSKHRYGIAYTTGGNKTAIYRGQFHQIFKDWDLQVNGYFADGDFYNYFYGLGNSSDKQDDLFDDDFYEAKVNKAHFSVGIMKDFWRKSKVDFTVGIEQNNSERLENTILDEDAGLIFGANQKLTILPIETNLDIDFRDSKGLPYRGIRAVVAYQNGTILNGDNQNYGVAKGSLEYYLSTKTKNPLTFGFRVGGAVGHGDIPWYKLPTLGNANGLRGYFGNRFAGESSAYFNFELRYQLFEKYTSFLPVKVGVKAFYDRGRVFFEEIEESDSWREGYGFGFYVVPLSETFTISLGIGFSDEESAYPTIGIGAPLR